MIRFTHVYIVLFYQELRRLELFRDNIMPCISKSKDKLIIVWLRYALTTIFWHDYRCLGPIQYKEKTNIVSRPFNGNLYIGKTNSFLIGPLAVS